MIVSGISTVFCVCLKRRSYESIWDSGEVMRLFLIIYQVSSDPFPANIKSCQLPKNC